MKIKKKFVLFLVFCAAVISCSNSSLSSSPNDPYEVELKFVVKTQGNHPSKISTVFLESGFFKYEDSYKVTKYPFTKEYGQRVKSNFNAVLKYEDKSKNLSVNYPVTLQIFNGARMIEEKTVIITPFNKKINSSTGIIVGIRY
ncbi:MAG: hypothetical protein ACWIPJ_03215 [Polaribacter sp.]